LAKKFAFPTSNQPTYGGIESRQGDFAELLFMQHAILHGYEVMFPFSKNSAFDVVLYTVQRGFLRVQVRSTGYCGQHDRFGMSILYGLDKKKRFTPELVDCIAVYIVPHHAWYIIPASQLDGRCNFFFRPHRPSHDPCARFREAWGLLSSAALAA
jgi:hypothetical protein